MVLPDPDFTWDPVNGECIAGVRPYRLNSFRLEASTLGAKFLVHNYGHGGAGITMSWGCADEVRQLITAHAPPSPANKVAVLGGGVMGLTSAYVLHMAGYPVSIYASELTDTTSDRAGGQWAPSYVKHGSGAAANARYGRILKTAYQMHLARLGPAYGVSKRTNYCQMKAEGLETVADFGIIPPPKRLKLPFTHLNRLGWAYETLLVEPPLFLTKLRRELKPIVPSTKQTFASQADIANLGEAIIVNCTGIGSMTLFNDLDMRPTKGTLVLLPSQPKLQYLYSTGSTYIFPRADHVVVGGSFEEGVATTACDRALASTILQRAVDTFAGKSLRTFEKLPWAIRAK